MNLKKKSNRIFLITAIVAVLLTLSIAFDIAMSYNVYKYQPKYFILAESNHFLTNQLSSGTPFFMCWQVYIGFIIVFCYLLLGFLATYKTTWTKCLIFSLVSSMLVVKAFLHIYGGLSWIIY